MYTQRSRREAVRPKFLMVLVSLSNQCLWLICSPYSVFLRSQNLLGWMNGQKMGDGRFDYVSSIFYQGGITEGVLAVTLSEA